MMKGGDSGVEKVPTPISPEKLVAWLYQSLPIGGNRDTFSFTGVSEAFEIPQTPSKRFLFSRLPNPFGEAPVFLVHTRFRSGIRGGLGRSLEVHTLYITR